MTGAEQAAKTLVQAPPVGTSGAERRAQWLALVEQHTAPERTRRAKALRARGAELVRQTAAGLLVPRCEHSDGTSHRLVLAPDRRSGHCPSCPLVRVGAVREFGRPVPIPGRVTAHGSSEPRRRRAARAELEELVSRAHFPSSAERQAKNSAKIADLESQVRALAPREPGSRAEYGPSAVGAWHEARATANETRFKRLVNCGRGQVTLGCTQCGHAETAPLGCGDRWFCTSCRDAQLKRVRERLHHRIVGVHLETERRGLQYRYRSRLLGGPWRHQMITLTLPHEGRPVERIERAFAAWPRFARLLRAHLEVVCPGNADAAHWIRAFEWTQGADSMGHPHFHVWICCPFLKAQDVRELWGRALHGWSWDSATPCVVHVRQVSTWGADQAGGTVPVNFDRLLSELVKYMAKDLGAGGELVDPEVFAAVWGAVTLRRCWQSSARIAEYETMRPIACPCCHVLVYQKGTERPRLYHPHDDDPDAPEWVHWTWRRVEIDNGCPRDADWIPPIGWWDNGYRDCLPARLRALWDRAKHMEAADLWATVHEVRRLHARDLARERWHSERLEPPAPLPDLEPTAWDSLGWAARDRLLDALSYKLDQVLRR